MDYARYDIKKRKSQEYSKVFGLCYLSNGVDVYCRRLWSKLPWEVKIGV